MNIVITDLLANKLMQKSLSVAQKICYIISLKDMLYIYINIDLYSINILNVRCPWSKIT